MTFETNKKMKNSNRQAADTEINIHQCKKMLTDPTTNPDLVSTENEFARTSAKQSTPLTS